MGQIGRHLSLNTRILKQCREQLGLSIEEVARNVSSIDKIENRQKWPTHKQLEELAKLYEVPSWVFISETLPPEYHYTQKPSFRGFVNESAFEPKVRKLVTRLESFRDFLIELKQDLQEPISPFTPLPLQGFSAAKAARFVRNWLNLEQPLSFSELKQKLEEKSVFIFLTSKYPDWSKIDHEVLRGLCLPHPTLPIIIINDSDAKKAQSFTLMPEVGHLLRGNRSIDRWQESESDDEKWCDQFAGNVLIPSNWLTAIGTITELKSLKKYATTLQISPYAFLVRLRQSHKIDQRQYEHFERELENEYQRWQEKLKKNKGGPRRNRPQEVRRQYGDLFINTVLTAWHNEEISLHKTSQLLGLKRASQVLELEP